MLFQKGMVVKAWPVTAFYFKGTFSDTPVRMAVSVPKKRIRLAVNRNRIKRMMREAYRLHQNQISDFFRDKKISLSIMFVFNANEVPEYKLIESKIILILQRLLAGHEADRD